MKTKITLFVVLCLAFFMWSPVSFSQPINVTAGTVTTCPGTTNVLVPIYVDNLANVSSISLSLLYNGADMTYTGYTLNPAVTGGQILVFNPGNAKVKAAWYSLGSTANLPNGSTLITFKFTVNGSSTLNWDLINLSDCEFSDFDGNVIDATWNNGMMNANMPDADFSVSPFICPEGAASISLDFTAGTAPFDFVYNDGVNPDVTVTGVTSPYGFNTFPTEMTTYNLVSITDNLGCVNAAVNKSATVQFSPIPTEFNVGGGGSYCEGSAGSVITLDGSQENILYEPLVNGVPTGNIVDGTGLPISFAPQTTAGTYTVIGYTGCDTLVMTGSVDITILPAPVVTLDPFAPVCTSNGFALSGGFPDGGTYTGSFVSVGGDFFLTPDVPGSYTVTYTYTNTDGCSASASQDVTVNPYTVPTWSWDGVGNILTCLQHTPLQLYGSPSGGTFSGDGIVGDMFDPALAGVGPHDITYTYTNEFGCTSDMTEVASVYETTVSMDPVANMCIDAQGVQLNGTPAGGWFEGPGVSVDYFFPSLAGAGTHTLMYHYSDGPGCDYTVTQDVTVYDLPVIELGEIAPICANTEAIQLWGLGLPLGGTYAGPGVNGAGFIPSITGIGVFTISYTYTDDNGCSNMATTQATVVPLPDITFYPDLSVVCESGDPVALTTLPAGGDLSGTGISPDDGMFHPELSGPGTFTLSYSYMDNNGCSSTSTFDITVLPLPEVTMDPLMNVCINEPFVMLSASPAGGYFTGDGVSADMFYPSSAGPGTHTIVYTYTDPVTGCSNYAQQDITVFDMPVIDFPPLADVCANSTDPVMLDASPAGGTYSGAGVVDNTFVPSIVGPGAYLLFYDYTDPNGCSATGYQSIHVNAAPSIYFYASSGEVCVSGDPLDLYAIPEPGTIEGPGVVGSQFFPDIAGVGTFTLTYTTTSAENCTSTATISITVDPLPDVTMAPLSDVCADAAPVDLSGNPEGGYFSGDGVYGTTFFPNSVVPGAYVITYNFMSQSGCWNTASQMINVFPLPAVSLDPLTDVCSNTASVTLNGQPNGGNYSGPGVVENSFFPDQVGPGSYTISYTFTDEHGCTSSASQIITVHPQPYLNFLADAYSVCVDGQPFSVHGYPEGGNYSGQGLTNDIFDPAMAGPGTWTLTYSYTDQYGCSSSTNLDITVHALPTVTFTIPNNPVCLGADPFALNGQPEFGWYTTDGGGLFGNIFYPADHGIGTSTITYHYTDENGCSNSASADITVVNGVTASIDPVSPMCANADPVLLTGTPEGGEFAGIGVVNNTFQPVNGSGTYTVTYTVSGGAGCVSVASIDIIVNPLPSITFDPLPDACVDGSPLDLFAYPQGGSFSGVGVIGNTFFPFLAGIGAFSITYNYTDQNGCSNTASQTIMVLEAGQVVFNPLANTCTDGNAVLLEAFPSGGVFSGTGVTGNYFDPQVAGPGTFTIIYEFGGGGQCSGSASQDITVFTAPTVTLDPPGNVCENGDAILLNGLPEGGNYSGPGIIGNMFYPILTGSGTFTLEYTYNDPNGCSGIAQQLINVYSVPTIDFTSIPASVCVGSGPVLLDATPAGGVFSGPGVLGNFFFPDIAGLGSYTITYSYTSENMCSNTATQQIDVLNGAAVSMIPVGPLCLGSDAVMLEGTPAGGSFSGENVIDGWFYPVTAGSFDVTYHYYNEGCTSEITQTIVVNPLPEVSLDPLGPLCQAGDPLILNGNPAGGIYSGTGVVENFFLPSSVDPGTYAVTYTFTDDNGCTNMAQQQITVNALPDASIGATSVEVCQGESTNLMITFTAGIAPWTVNLSDGMQYSSSSSVLTIPITPATSQDWMILSITDGNNCINGTLNASVYITVMPAPDVYNVAGGGVLCNGTGSTSIYLSGSQSDVIYSLMRDGLPTGDVVYGDGGVLIFDPVTLPGQYTIQASWAALQCTSLMNGAADVIANPTLVVDAGSTIVIAAGTTADLMAMVTGGTGPYTYAWTPASSLDDPTLDNPVASPSVTTIYNVVVTDAVGCTGSAQVQVTVLSTTTNLSGTVSYFNSLMTPINGATVVLMDMSGNPLGTTTTDLNGEYLFSDIPAGFYKVTASTGKPWGGGNGADGLLMLKHFAGHPYLTGLKLMAGDVSGNNVINAFDGLNTLRRFVGLINTFMPVPDWVFETITTQVCAACPNIADINALCMGDVNGDYIPGMKVKPSINLSNEGQILVNSGSEVSLPVIAEENMTVGSMSLILDIPTGVEITGVVLNSNLDNLVYNIKDNQLKIGWCNLEPLELKAGQSLLNIKMRIHGNVNDITMNIDGSSNITDDNAIVIDNARLRIPKLTSNQLSLELNNVPNPFNGSTEIRYSVPVSGKLSIKLYNVIGEQVSELINADQSAGNYTLRLDGSSLRQGVYLLKLEVNGMVKTRMINVSK